jgi:hypothetical protein
MNPLQPESVLYPFFDTLNDGRFSDMLKYGNNYEHWLLESPESITDYGDDGTLHLPSVFALLIVRTGSMIHLVAESGAVIPHDFGYYFGFASRSCAQQGLDFPDHSSSPSSASSSLPSPTLSSSTSCPWSSLTLSSTKTSRRLETAPYSPLSSARRIGSSQRAVNDNENDQRRRFSCLTPGCTRRFTSQYTLKVHMDAHKPKPRTSFPCTLGCSETFSRQHDRLRHEVAKHGKVCDWLCHDCGRFFSSKKTLGNHKCPNAPGGTRWVAETVRRTNGLTYTS